MSRFRSNLYFIEKYVFCDHQHYRVRSDDGTLFSGAFRTKILPQDLPDWYVFGRYYKRFGYMSTKGITDMLYVPSKHSNHYLKDDCLYISYGGKIDAVELPEKGAFYERYKGYDHTVWGSEIIGILKGAQIYSDYDISSFIQQLKVKKDWLINEYPDEFGHGRWQFDVDACFAEPFDNGHPLKYYAISLNDYFSPSSVSGVKHYYGTLKQIGNFINSLDQEQYKETVSAFKEYLSGNTSATHVVAYAERKLLEPVTLVGDAYLLLEKVEWDFKNVWERIYRMRLKEAYVDAILIKDGEEYIRCIRPRLKELCYQSDLENADTWIPVQSAWGHPGIVAFDNENNKNIRCSLYLPEKRYGDVKPTMAELHSENVDMGIVCEDIFADG